MFFPQRLLFLWWSYARPKVSVYLQNFVQLKLKTVQLNLMKEPTCISVINKAYMFTEPLKLGLIYLPHISK